MLDVLQHVLLKSTHGLEHMRANLDFSDECFLGLIVELSDCHFVDSVLQLLFNRPDRMYCFAHALIQFFPRPSFGRNLRLKPCSGYPFVSGALMQAICSNKPLP